MANDLPCCPRRAETDNSKIVMKTGSSPYSTGAIYYQKSILGKSLYGHFKVRFVIQKTGLDFPVNASNARQFIQIQRLLHWRYAPQPAAMQSDIQSYYAYRMTCELGKENYEYS